MKFAWFRCAAICLLTLSQIPSQARAQDKSPQPVALGVYEYESKPDHEAFAKFNPAKAPAPGPLLLREGDRLAIIGDSITEQKMYSRLIETYLTACRPDLKITVRQYGWSGEKTDGFLRRMEKDCLTFKPTVATICYGMNDARYRPFDATNGRWYADHYTAIVRKFKEHDVRVVVGSPGCSGKLASWVKARSGTLDELNLNLCSLRDIALDVASKEQVRFADIFWPMYQQQVLAPGRFNKSADDYAVAGKDGVHPGWAGHVIMAYAFLTALGLDGDLGTVSVDWTDGKATATGKHDLKSFSDGTLQLISYQMPFCATGELDSDASIRSGMTLVPFAEKLNRFTLKVRGLDKRSIKVTWGNSSQTFKAEEAEAGINLADKFTVNPFSTAFEKIDAAVQAKQTFETKQVKQIFHGERGKKDFELAVKETEAERQPLADAIAQAVVPVDHSIKIELVPNP